MSFFRKIWAIYGVILFLAMTLLSIPYMLLNIVITPGPRALRHNIWYMYHPFTTVFLTLVGVRLKIHGREHIDTNQSYIVVANHRSSLDFIVNAAAFPGIFRFLAKEDLLKVPIFGWLVRRLCLTVDRTSAMSRARSVVNIRQQVAEGWSVLIYPEGGRNTTGAPLAPFFDGAFRIAKQVGAPVVVQTIANVHEVSGSKQAIDLWPGTLHIYWDKPLTAAEVASDDLNTIKEKVQALMLAHLD